ncbi:RNA polymerase sigma factor [Roseovarius sp. Pro17]|uniref:RNA polymerase sigma factor n=1 Tax=Roseovarius sp. Pro17 TaxID=3108175 RepID=UPI002D767111|nr:RNA polymerase sigma factor [Roseovarius sp. Pro17]
MGSEKALLRTSYRGTSEAELVSLARERNDAAVRELIRRCNQQLFRVARGILHNDSEAEDAVQSAYMAAFTKLETFRGDAAFSTWLTRIVMNEAYNCLRRRRPVVDITEYREGMLNTDEGGMSGTMTPTPKNPESEFACAELRAILEAAIDALPERFRLTYVMRDVQEMPTRDVANLLGINTVTVKTRLFRARRLLRSELNKTVKGGFSSIFPFDGARCTGMADRVILSLTTRPDN